MTWKSTHGSSITVMTRITRSGRRNRTHGGYTICTAMSLSGCWINIFLSFTAHRRRPPIHLRSRRRCIPEWSAAAVGTTIPICFAAPLAKDRAKTGKNKIHRFREASGIIQMHSVLVFASCDRSFQRPQTRKLRNGKRQLPNKKTLKNRP